MRRIINSTNVSLDGPATPDAGQHQVKEPTEPGGTRRNS